MEIVQKLGNILEEDSVNAKVGYLFYPLIGCINQALVDKLI